MSAISRRYYIYNQQKKKYSFFSSDPKSLYMCVFKMKECKRCCVCVCICVCVCVFSSLLLLLLRYRTLGLAQITD